LATYEYLPGRWVKKTADDIDQGAFAGTVFPHQSVHLSAKEPEINAIQSPDPWELLGNSSQTEDRGLESCLIGSHLKSAPKAQLNIAGRSIFVGVYFWIN
jgi:hypothetical protein